ncbi:hypothetical protein BH11PLA1_BH11PLA1_13410 [soil metagenome]
MVPTRLEVKQGPRLDALLLPGSGSAIFGRKSTCALRTPDTELSISREHCRFTRLAQGMVVADLGSRHGTILNGERLKPEVETPLRVGDLLTLGPWTLEATVAGSVITTMPMVDSGANAARVETMAEMNRAAIDQRRLVMLLDLARGMAEIHDEKALAEAVVDSLRDATGYSAAAFIRPDFKRGQIQLLALRHATNTVYQPTFSLSLIKAASEGKAVQVRPNSGAFAEAHSMIGVHTCLCVPVMVDGVMTHCLYLDCREGGAGGAGGGGALRVQADAADFCQAVADLCAVALGALARADAEQARARMSEQMEAANLIQQVILPQPSGRVRSVTYHMHVEPGRMVAGDLFDIFELDGGRVAVVLGDVSGKGVPAAMIAALTQSYLTAALHSTQDLERSIAGLHRYLCGKIAENKFVSLMAAIIDTRDGSTRYVDAGHGYWLVRRAAGGVEELERTEGGPPLRCVPETSYVTGTLQLNAGDRLMIFSDGVVDQKAGGKGEGFGLARVHDAIAATRSTEEDVTGLLEAVFAHARGGATGKPELTDDVTVASVVWEGPGSGD